MTQKDPRDVICDVTQSQKRKNKVRQYMIRKATIFDVSEVGFYH